MGDLGLPGFLIEIFHLSLSVEIHITIVNEGLHKVMRGLKLGSLSFSISEALLKACNLGEGHLVGLAVDRSHSSLLFDFFLGASAFAADLEKMGRDSFRAI